MLLPEPSSIIQINYHHPSQTKVREINPRKNEGNEEERKKYARHLTLESRWALRVSSFKQIILGHIRHLKTDLHFIIQAGISAGNNSFSAMILECVSSASEPHLPDKWLWVRICLSFPVSASSSTMVRPAIQQSHQISRNVLNHGITHSLCVCVCTHW